MNCGQQMQHSEKKSNMRRTPRANYNLVLEELRAFTLDLNLQGFSTSFKFIPTSRNDPTTKRGTCVSDNLETYQKLEKKGAKMMMGELRSRHKEWAEIDECRGLPIYHVWVEVGDMVYDVSNGNKIIAPTDLYYFAKRVVRAEQVQVVKQVKMLSIGIMNRWTLDEKQVNPFAKTIREKQRRLGVHFDD